MTLGIRMYYKSKCEKSPELKRYILIYLLHIKHNILRGMLFRYYHIQRHVQHCQFVVSVASANMGLSAPMSQMIPALFPSCSLHILSQWQMIYARYICQLYYICQYIYVYVCMHKYIYLYIYKENLWIEQYLFLHNVGHKHLFADIKTLNNCL